MVHFIVTRLSVKEANTLHATGNTSHSLIEPALRTHNHAEMVLM